VYTALKIFYLGEPFYGAVRQPGLPTVQEEMEKALSRQGIMVRVRFSSRTDRGVSAIDNIAYYKGDPPKLSLLNASMKNVLAWGLYKGDERPFITEKTYLYVLPGRFDPREMIRAVKKSFTWERICKEGSVKDVPQVKVEVEGGLTLIWFSAKSFCWQMIRRAVGYAVSFLTENKFFVAPPEGLVLVRTKSNVKFEISPKWLAELGNRVKKLMWKFAGVYGIYRGLTSSGLSRSWSPERTTLSYP